MINYASLKRAMKPKVALNAQTLNLARDFVYDSWCERSRELGYSPAFMPSDLSGSCKFSSLFVQRVFGGTVEANYHHCFNRIDGVVIDLNEHAMDVLSMDNPYLHDEVFANDPEFHESLESCLPRVEKWASEFIEKALSMGFGPSPQKPRDKDSVFLPPSI